MLPINNLLENAIKNKIICITGANGFIGKKLVFELSRIQCQIRILTRKKNKISNNNIDTFIGDLTDPKLSLKKFLKDCDILFHCAGEIKNEEKMNLLHVQGTQKLLNSIEIKSKKKLHWIQLSSCGAYGPPNNFEIQSKRIINESSKCNPMNKYERTKTKSDNLVINASTNKFIYTILRPSNVIGPDMKNQSVFKLIRLIKFKKFFFIGKKDSICTFVHVDDVVKALILISSNQKKSENEIFNISNDCTWEELIKKISFYLGVKAPTLRVPYIFIKFSYNIIRLAISKFYQIPNLDPFVYKTMYPSKKIENYLGFKFSKPMPNSIRDLIN